jgi:hypothetical protein
VVIVDAAAVAVDPPAENRHEVTAKGLLRQALKLEDPARVAAAFQLFDRSWPSWVEAREQHDRVKEAYAQRQVAQARALAGDGKCDEMRALAKRVPPPWSDVADAVLAEPCTVAEEKQPEKKPAKQPEKKPAKDPEPSGDLDELVSEAENAARSGQYGRALKLCEDALSQDKFNVRAITACAIASCNLKIAAKAKTYIGRLGGQTSRHAVMRSICQRSGVEID